MIPITRSLPERGSPKYAGWYIHIMNTS